MLTPAEPRGELRAPDDDGFTLVELIITVAILGIITVTLTGVLFQYFRTTTDTQSRLSESVDQQFVAAYWQQDVASVGLRDYKPDAASEQFPALKSTWTATAPTKAPAKCNPAAPGRETVGQIVVGMLWNDYENPSAAADPFKTWSDATVKSAVYTAQQESSGQWTLRRYTCVGDKVAQPIVLARSLKSKPSVRCDGGDCDLATPPGRMSITLEVQDLANKRSSGYTVTLDAQRRQG